jgi:CDP-diacylglycerol--glycerol-3-phosphate 3-phosphatidyltransferase
VKREMGSAGLRDRGGKRPARDLWKLPNLLTLSRILASPLFIWLLWKPRTWSDVLAALTFAAAGATDFLDGYTARKRGMVTRLGQFLDPLADKIYISVALVMLAHLGRMGWWVPGVIIGRELVITALRVYAGRMGVSVPASLAAKLKTNTQIIMIVLLMLHFKVGGEYLHEIIAIWLAVALTVYSGLDYLVNVERYVGRKRRDAA